MRIIKTGFILLLILLFVSSIVFAEKQNQIVSVEDNLINISAPETTYCQGTTCVIEFTITNKNDVDKNLIPSNYFYSNQIIPLKLEKYGDVTETRIVNVPYQCNCVEDEVNSSIVCQTCDNITTYDYTYKGYYEMPSEKDSKEIKNKDFTKIQKSGVEKFRATIYQPLGQKTKYDIKTTDDTNTETILDPWTDSNNYYINLSKYLFIFNQVNQTGSMSDGGANSGIGGFKFVANRNFNISSIQVHASEKTSGITRCMVLNSGKTIINTSISYDSSTGYAIFNNYTLIAGTTYYFGCDKGGASTTNYYVGVSFPLNYTNFNVTGGYFAGADHGTAWTHIIQINTNYFFNLQNITLFNIYDNLSINTTYIGVQIDYNPSIVIQLNDTALGNNLVSGQCYNLLQNSLNWTIVANLNYSQDLSRVVNYTFTTCLADKTMGLQSIIEGVSASELGNAYTAYDNKTVYIRLANGSQYTGRFDKFIVSGNKRYAFNYEQNSTSSFSLSMTNITPVFYVWQNINMSTVQIRSSVQTLIDNTN